MKNQTTKLFIAAGLCLGLLFTSCAEDKKETKSDVTFKDDKTEEMFTNYLALKDALVESDAEKAQKEGEKLAIKLEEMQRPIEGIRIISESDNIEEQRRGFLEVSAHMTEIVAGGGIESGEVYYQYCPMAFDNNGAHWLSSEKEIRNPYFGDKMLKCGKTQDTFKKQ